MIWATGFRLDHSFVELPVLRRRAARSCTGAASPPLPGLYFLGLPWQHTRGSALLGWVKDDAAYIAQRIAEHAAALPPGGAVTSFDVRVGRREPPARPASPLARVTPPG